MRRRGGSSLFRLPRRRRGLEGEGEAMMDVGGTCEVDDARTVENGDTCAGDIEEEAGGGEVEEGEDEENDGEGEA